MVGRGEEGPPCDPGSELLLGGRASARIINGMEKKKKAARLSFIFSWFCFSVYSVPADGLPVSLRGHGLVRGNEPS